MPRSRARGSPPRSSSSTTDRPTGRHADEAGTRTPLRVVRQPNRGRFEARRTGIEHASGKYCLLLDSRVQLDPGALSFVEDQVAADASRDVWNGHVEIAREGPYSVFWDVVTQRAFWTYFGAPRTTSFGREDFARLPKGTTCTFAP